MHIPSDDHGRIPVAQCLYGVSSAIISAARDGHPGTVLKTMRRFMNIRI